MPASMTVAGERATWQNPRIFSTLLLVFLAGGAAGAVSMKFGLHELLHRSSVPASKEAVLQKFRSDLNLTPRKPKKSRSSSTTTATTIKASRINRTTSAPPGK